MYFIAFRDRGSDMVPASKDGHILVFDTLEDARRARGFLGVAAPTDLQGLERTCKEHGLKIPKTYDSDHGQVIGPVPEWL